VEPAIARTIASKNHAGQRNRFGDLVIDHVERVAAAVREDARATAILHDLSELCPTGRWQLRRKPHSYRTAGPGAADARCGRELRGVHSRIADAPGPTEPPVSAS